MKGSLKPFTLFLAKVDCFGSKWGRLEGTGREGKEEKIQYSFNHVPIRDNFLHRAFGLWKNWGTGQTFSQLFLGRISPSWVWGKKTVLLDCPCVLMSSLKWMAKESLAVCRQAVELNHPDKWRQVSLSLLKNMFPSRRLIMIKYIKMSSWLFSKSSICFKICTLSFAKKYSLQHCETAFALEIKGGSHSTRLRPPCIQIRYSV